MDGIDLTFLIINGGTMVFCGWLALQGIKEGYRMQDVAIPLCTSAPLVYNAVVLFIVIKTLS